MNDDIPKQRDIIVFRFLIKKKNFQFVNSFQIEIIILLTKAASKSDIMGSLDNNNKS